MNPVVIIRCALLLTILATVGCASAPEAVVDPYNSADSQRSRAEQAQDELSSEVPRER